MLLEITACWDLRLCRLDSLTPNIKALQPLEALRPMHPTVRRHSPQHVTFHVKVAVFCHARLLLFVKNTNVAYNVQICNFAILILLIQDL